MPDRHPIPHIQNCLGELRDEICIPHLDDVIVFSETFSEHIKHVLQRLKSYGVHSSNGKCVSLEELSQDGYQIDPKATSAAMAMKSLRPQTVGEVRRLMGLLGVYRRHIINFAHIAKPIYDLLSLDLRKKGNVTSNKHSLRGNSVQVPPSSPVQ